MSDADRIAALEHVVRALRAEVADLREAVLRLSSDATRSGAHVAEQGERERREPVAPPLTPPPSSPAPHAPRPPADVPHAPGQAVPPFAARDVPRATVPSRPAREPLDLESLIGRYGTIALATLTIVVGAGAFLTWAIANGKLGPHVRLVIGAVVAVAVAALGLRLRARGAERFGNVLLGLALALAHVEAWGAGPSLHVVSSGVALAIAAAASAALAALALHIDEESLFVVGTGGALLAPFVVSDGRGNLFVLLGYGLVVLALGLYAVRHRAWALASWLMLLGCLVYAAVGIDMGSTLAGWRPALAPALFVLCCAWSAALWGGARQRRTFVLGYLAVVLLAHIAAIKPASAPIAIALGIPIAATVTAYLIARLPELSEPAHVMAAVLLPLGFFGAALLVMDRATSGPHGMALSALWTAFAACAAWDADSDTRPVHIMVAGLTSGAAVLFALHAHPLPLAVVLAAHAVLFALIFRRWPADVLLVPIVLALSIAVVATYEQLLARAAYTYTPFVTRPSAAMLAVSLACWLVWMQFRQTALDAAARPRASVDGDVHAPGSSAPTLHQPAAILAAIVTFFWGRAELAHAYSPDVAIFLLVLYFAAVGVLAIYTGRRRALPLARFIGLALAIYAALKAVLRAWSYGAVGFKVGSCALAGAFLLAVAYWYRESHLAHSLPPSATGGADGSGQRAQQAAQDAG
ncbi:MAG TPA: DUF2339 domain-containing protein [Gemmatimonadaceae bacterium]|nr:DUF2339 domain-containing protein [Gemmatimonadaceae bacterium]